MKKPNPQIVAFLLTSGLGISFLVFLNAAQPFVLKQILNLPDEQLLRVSSTLIFSDELLALIMVLFWGRVADRLSPRVTTAIANAVVAVALFFFVNVKNAFPGLLLLRLLFSLGASGITTMLSASLSVLSSVPLTQRPSISLPDDEADEDDSLHGDVQPSIGWRSPISLANRRAKQKPAALSALLGISAGLGALLAVFLFLRIPACVPSHSEDGEATKHGLRIAFYTVGVLALVNALIALVALPGRSALGRIVAEETTFLGYIKYELGQILKGFKLARKNVQIALACAGGFAARAQTIAVSAFVPIYVASYFFKQGRCDPSSSEDWKQSCREAYALASAISGVTQLVALLSGFIFIFISNLSRTLSITSLLGCVSFAVLGRSAFGDALGGEDPNNIGTWIATVGVGLAQTGSVTISLALIARERERMTIAKRLLEDDESGDAASADYDSHAMTQEEETAGALAGAYSFCGGLGVLSISALAALPRHNAAASAPFLGIAGIDLLLALGALAVTMRRSE